MKAQSIILKLEHRVVNIIHLNSYLYLLENEYRDFSSTQKDIILAETKEMVSFSVDLVYKSLNEIKNYREYLPKKFKSATLQDYIFRKNKYRFTNFDKSESAKLSSNMQSDSISLIMIIMETLKNSHNIQSTLNYPSAPSKNITKSAEKEAKKERIDNLKEMFINLESIFEIIYENMKIDPYASFVTNYNYVIFLITASLILNTVNGIFIIKFLHGSLKFLDKNFKLVTEIGHQDILNIKSKLSVFKKMELNNNQIDLIKKHASKQKKKGKLYLSILSLDFYLTQL